MQCFGCAPTPKQSDVGPVVIWQWKLQSEQANAGATLPSVFSRRRETAEKELGR